ncbi:MAG: RpiB/LacA/LacB family sugar-phosphate isomerase [Burkholderiales bacterium]
MKISIGCDELGIAYKQMIIDTFSKKGHEFLDAGVSEGEKINYPTVAYKAIRQMKEKACDRCILICGTGIGMALTANKIEGAYAAVCHDVYSTERSILSNNCNTMCIGALVVGPKTVESLVGLWLDLKFDPNSRSYPKVQEIYAIEAEQGGKHAAK